MQIDFLKAFYFAPNPGGTERLSPHTQFATSVRDGQKKGTHKTACKINSGSCHERTPLLDMVAGKVSEKAEEQWEPSKAGHGGRLQEPWHVGHGGRLLEPW